MAHATTRCFDKYQFAHCYLITCFRVVLYNFDYVFLSSCVSILTSAASYSYSYFSHQDSPHHVRVQELIYHLYVLLRAHRQSTGVSHRTADGA